MTNEKAIKTLSGAHDLLLQCHVRFEFVSEFKEALQIATDALEKAEKYKWHDLRKNPEDLPKPLSLCIICVKRWSKIIDDWIIGDYKLTEFTDGFEYAKGWYGLPEPEVLAWRYIEPFEEET